MFSRLKGVSTMHKRKRNIRGRKKKKYSTRDGRRAEFDSNGTNVVQNERGYADLGQEMDNNVGVSSRLSPSASRIREEGHAKAPEIVYEASPIRLDVDSLMKDSSDVKREVENKVEEIERRYDEKFRSLRDELRRVREEEARAAVILKQTCDEKVGKLEEKVRILEEEKSEFERVKTKLSEQAKQGFIDLYQDLTKKSKDIADSLQAEKEKASSALSTANEKIEELAYALKAERELHQRTLLEHTQATQNLESLLADARAEAARVRAELVSQRKSMAEMQETRLERANREAKEILDLSRQEAVEYKKDLARERRKIAVLEDEFAVKFQTFCTTLEAEMRARSLEMIETKMKSIRASLPKSKVVAKVEENIPSESRVVSATSVSTIDEEKKISSVVDAEAAVSNLKKFIAQHRKGHEKTT